MQVSLKQQIGLCGGVSFVAGSIIGSGIFISPSTVFIGCGYSVGLTLVMWSVCGMLAFSGALCYMELGSRIDKSGGNYTYIKEGFGDFISFIFLWASLIMRPMSVSLGCMASIEYLTAALFPCSELISSSTKTLLSLLILALIIFCNSYSVKLSTYYQVVNTVLKVAVLLMIICSGFYHLVSENNRNFDEAFKSKNLTLHGLTKSFYAAFFAYGGWDVLSFATEEIKKSKRILPLSVFIGMLLTTILYVLTNIAYHSVLGNADLTSDVAVANIFANRRLTLIKWVILPVISVSSIVIVNSNVFMASRMYFVAGRDEIFPQFLSMVNIPRRTPLVSILLLFISSVIVLMVGDITSLITTYTFLKITSSMMSVLSLYRIRRSHAQSNFKICLVFPVIYVSVAFAAGVSFLVVDSTVLLLSIIIICSGSIVFILFKTSFKYYSTVKDLNSAIVHLCYGLLLCEFSTESDYNENRHT